MPDVVYYVLTNIWKVYHKYNVNILKNLTITGLYREQDIVEKLKYL